MSVATLARPAGEVSAEWGAIFDARTPLVIVNQPLLAADVIASAIDALSAAGGLIVVTAITPSEIASALTVMPPAFSEDVTAQARAFSTLLRLDAVKLRVELIVTDACRLVHADYATVRLIKTYAGPGTDHAPDPARRDRLLRLPTGAMGLFKGHDFAVGHAPCFHRSPPIAFTGIKRLLLVLDEPAEAA